MVSRGRGGEGGELVQELQALSQALYRSGFHENMRQKKPPAIPARRRSAPSAVSTEAEEKRKRWNWKPLKALAGMAGSHRLSCEFSLHVHSVEGLPPRWDGQFLRVLWRRKDGGLKTRPARVSNGVAEFEEVLFHKCSVKGTRTGGNPSVRYESKFFEISVWASEETELCKHRIDLSRMLPDSTSSDGCYDLSGTWSTNFKLNAKNARGASLFVTLGFVVLGNNEDGVSSSSSSSSSSNRNPNPRVRKSSEVVRASGYQRPRSEPPFECDLPVLDVESIPPFSLDGESVIEGHDRGFVRSPQSDASVLFDFRPNLKFFNHDEDSLRKNVKDEEAVDADFSIVEKGVEIEKEQAKAKDSSQPDESFEETKGLAETDTEHPNSSSLIVPETDERSISNKEEENDQAICNLESLASENDLGHEKGKEKTGEEDLDALADSVEGEFLHMLGLDSPFSESDPDSPRGRLLREFEKESHGCCFGFDIGSDDDGTFLSSDMRHSPSPSDCHSDEEMGLESIVQVAESEFEKAAQAELSRTRAKIMEGAETEKLMQEWGMDERVFQHSSVPGSIDEFRDLVDIPVELPPLGEGYGPLVQTIDGGLLRSMNPMLFRNTRSKGSLVMQISKPVVVPAEMGTDVMDILGYLASVGIEQLSAEVHKRMPLEDITGKSIQEFAVNSHPAFESSRKLSLECPNGNPTPARGSLQTHVHEYSDLSKYNSVSGKAKASYAADKYTEYVSLEELAPLAMDKLEALSIEGLKIQSDMGEHKAPSNVNAMSMGGLSVFQGVESHSSGGLGLEGTAALHLLDTKGCSDDLGGLLDMSISLEEWLKLDSGAVDEQQTRERTAKILAAHHAIRPDLFILKASENDKENQGSKKCGNGRWGFMGNTLTIGLLVQLRDPLRNFEPVGASMMALVQAERIIVPPKPKIWKRVSEMGNSEEVDEPESVNCELEEISIPHKVEESQFRITQVHVAGLTTEKEDIKKTWGNPKQQQSGSRWLLANGMGKRAKHPFLRSKQGVTMPSKVKGEPGDSLWSISSRVFPDGGRGKEGPAMKSHVRNPNIILR